MFAKSPQTAALPSVHATSIWNKFLFACFIALLLSCSARANAAEAPYGGVAWPVPGTIQAENYDTGGQGVAYSIGTNEGTATSYRSDGVDLQTTTDTGGGYDIGWTTGGQWFRYTVNVATAGKYTVTFRVAAESAVSDAFHISNSAGTNLSGSVNVPSTGAWQTWTNVTATVTLPAGQQVLTVNEDNAGWNFNYFSLASLEGAYGGVPTAIPGTVQAENYDTGGQGVAYSADSTNGSANSYRSDGIDLETTTDAGGGYDLGWTTSGQWFNYTVNVATAGTYAVTFRVASPDAINDALHISNSSGTNLSGSVNIPVTGGYQTWTSVTVNVTLPAGQQILTIDQDNAGWNLNYVTFAAGSSSGEGPYGGVAAAVPGTVQAENYDTGGQGVGYSVDTTNGSANSYRSDGIDLETTSDTGGGYDVGWTYTGQWFRYSVNVATAGTYTVTFRVASPNAVTDAFHLANSAGTDLTGTVNVPATGGYQTWTNVTATVTLPAGPQVLTLDQDNAGWNINYFSIASGAGGGSSKVFAPYEYVGDLSDANQIAPIQLASGVKAITLAFLTPLNNGCNLVWPGASSALPYDTVGSTSMGTAISTMQARGVEVIISTGGAGGEDPSHYCTTSAQVQALYQSVINQYHVNWLDFDIEIAQNSGQLPLRDKALAALQKANPGLIISYTLAVGTYGLNDDDSGMNELTSAQTDGLDINVVNGMAMDFGTANLEMGTAANQAAAALEGQIQSIGSNSTVGITVLPGTNDPPPFESFSLADANTVLNFAQANSYVTELSFWELNRDNGSCAGDQSQDYDSCTGLTQSNYEFSQIFEAF
jgi:uncharacterized protein involved in high-affinity Fe2+ transport